MEGWRSYTFHKFYGEEFPEYLSGLGFNRQMVNYLVQVASSEGL